MNEEQMTEILRVLDGVSDAFRRTMTEEERAALDARHATEQATPHSPAASREEAMLEFTADALQTLADDIGAVIERRREALHQQALEVYYEAEKLSREPEHAHLIAHVEAMRRAYENEYGYPPPPRK